MGWFILYFCYWCAVCYIIFISQFLVESRDLSINVIQGCLTGSAATLWLWSKAWWSLCLQGPSTMPAGTLMISKFFMVIEDFQCVLADQMTMLRWPMTLSKWPTIFHEITQTFWQLIILVMVTKNYNDDIPYNITVMSHERHGDSNHPQLNCLFNSLFRSTTRQISKIGNVNPLRGDSMWWLQLDSSHNRPVMWKVFACRKTSSYWLCSPYWWLSAWLQ